MITAGPTHEKIDPVRFIGNYSSGKMGFAIAERLAFLGAQVILVTGPVNLTIKSPAIQRVDVTSAEEMYLACIHYFPECNGAIMSAAVADFAPVSYENQKIKRSDEGVRSLELKPNKDIAARLGKMKRADQLLVGFALESQQELENALSKLKRKNLDLIVLNSLRDEGSGFGVDTNKITIIDRKENVFPYPLKSKQDVAVDIVDKLIESESLLLTLL